MGRAVAAGRFEAGEGEEVVEEVEHAAPFLLHEGGEFPALRGGQVGMVGEGFEEAVDDGERGAQFVRDVGDEGGAAGVELFGAADVLADEELVVFVEGGEDELQGAAGLFAVRQGEFEGVGVFARLLQEAVEFGVAHEVGQDVAAVAVLQVEVVGGEAVHPVDAFVRVEDDDAVGQGFGGAGEALQGLGEFLFAFFAGFRLA